MFGVGAPPSNGFFGVAVVLADIALNFARKIFDPGKDSARFSALQATSPPPVGGTWEAREHRMSNRHCASSLASDS